MCQFVLSTKKLSEEKWSNIEVEYDFSNYGENSNQGKTHKMRLIFPAEKGRQKEAILVLNWHITPYDSNDIE